MSDVILFQVIRDELWRALQESDISFEVGEVDNLVDEIARMEEKLKSGWLDAMVESIKQEREPHQASEEEQLFRKVAKVRTKLLNKMLDGILQEDEEHQEARSHPDAGENQENSDTDVGNGTLEEKDEGCKPEEDIDREKRIWWKWWQ